MRNAEDRLLPPPTDATADVAALARVPVDAAPLSSVQPLAVFKSLWRLFAARPQVLLGGLMAAVMRAGALLFVSVAVGRVVAGDARALGAVAATVGVTVSATLGYVGQRWVIDAVQDGLTSLRMRLVDCQLALSIDTVQHLGPEGFVLAMTRDSELLGQMARACFGGLLPGLVLMMLCLAGIAVMVPTLALPLAVAMLLLWLARKSLARRLTRQMTVTHAAIDRLYEQLGGTVLRHEMATSQANEAQERAACQASISQTHALTRMLALTQSYTAELDSLVLGLALLGLIVWLIAGVGAASGASVASVVFLLFALRGALQGVLRALQEVAQGIPALTNVERLLALAPAPTHRGREPPTQWRLALHGVSRHIRGRTVVDAVDLALEPGRITVLKGANGAGKTTLLRVLLGLTEVDAGEVLVDGMRWADIDRAAFRRGVGYLPQNPVLFAGTVHDNLSYGAPDATAPRVKDMAEAVGLAGLLNRLPDGLASWLGAGGSPLSGGERQRVALARVLLRAPKLLVLDEPTNHLDGPSSEKLIALLRRAQSHPAVLIVSHDSTLIAQADEVLEMAEGRLRVLSCSTPRQAA